MIEKPEKKRKYGKTKKFLHRSPSHRWFRNRIHNFLSRAAALEEALPSFTVCDAHRYFVGQA